MLGEYIKILLKHLYHKYFLCRYDLCLKCPKTVWIALYGYYETDDSDANRDQARFSSWCCFCIGQPLQNHWLSYTIGRDLDLRA